jgi:hypothetical protein
MSGRAYAPRSPGPLVMPIRPLQIRVVLGSPDRLPTMPKHSTACASVWPRPILLSCRAVLIPDQTMRVHLSQTKFSGIKGTRGDEAAQKLDLFVCARAGKRAYTPFYRITMFVLTTAQCHS